MSTIVDIRHSKRLVENYPETLCPRGNKHLAHSRMLYWIEGDLNPFLNKTMALSGRGFSETPK